MMDEVRIFGYCENCGEKITDDNEEYYVNDEGRIFCSVDCLCEHHGITRVEV
jgi:hypothetical protein